MKKRLSSLKNIFVRDLKNFRCRKKGGLCADVVKKISAKKNEPKWMLDVRLQALEEFKSKPLPKWGPDLSFLNVDRILYYLKPFKKQQSSWDDVPDEIKKTFEKLGVPQAEREHLAGLGAQYESEVVYHNLKKEWADKGVIFCDTDTALKKYPELFKEYFCSIVPFTDNKFAALNTALWSGGSFIYVPKNVKVDIPLQSYFRINTDRLGQFERTLIIADEGSFVNYIEGCTASAYSKSCLHAAVVEVIAKKGARIRYSTLQNWSQNVSNLVTKRAVAYENSTVEWVDGNLGSGVTMKYPAVILKGENAKAEILSIALSSHEKQIQDAGAKVIHLASNTNSRIVSKSISSNGGISSYRGVVKVMPDAKNCKSFVQCDALMLDDKSQSNTYPYIDIRNSDSDVGHEASVSQIDDEKLFYLMSRGLNKNEAKTFVVNGFIEPFVKTLPMEYAVEMNRLVEMEMEDPSPSSVHPEPVEGRMNGYE